MTCKQAPPTPTGLEQEEEEEEVGTFSCFSSLILCSLALGMRMKMGPDLSSSFRFLAGGFLAAVP